MTRKASVVRSHEVGWLEPPGHQLSALSKLLVRPGIVETECLDVRLSLYAPGGYSASHVHQKSENVFYFLDGRGIVELDGEKVPVEAGVVVFVPPGVRHGIFNTGETALRFVFVASSPEDMPL